MTKQKTLTISIIVLVFFVISVYLVLRPSFVELFPGMSVKQMGPVEAFLSSHQIGFMFDDSGKKLLVEKAHLRELRRKLSEEGVVSEPRAGLEIFSGSDYGMTQFAQKINFLRAQQGELERTILTLNEISDVRVHISDPHRQSVFGAREKRSASVVITLKHGKKVTHGLVFGIQKLVSSSIDNVAEKDVSILDSYGRDLTSKSPFSGSGSLIDGENIQQRIEAETHKLLSALYPNSVIEVSATIDYDTSSSTATIESIPGKTGIIKRKQTKIFSGDKKHSNRQEDIEYLSGRKIEKIAIPSGRVTRISVGAVVVTPDKEGNQDRVRTLLISALGLNISRGDQLGLMFRKTATVVTAKQSTIVVGGGRHTVYSSVLDYTLSLKHGSVGSWSHYSTTVFAAGFIVSLILLGLLLVSRHRLTLAYQHSSVSLLDSEIDSLRRVLADELDESDAK